jgi:biopolymer transport protein ExbB
MMIDRSWLHDASFNLLYVSLALATFVMLERAVMFAWLSLCRRRVAQAIRRGGADAAAALSGSDVVTRNVREFVAQQKAARMTRAQADDLSAALYLEVDARVQARLWVLDTVVTAAPLLGLLGTILGIMDTFSALSSGGISDPAAVSRGIATALLATAIGIGTALYGLIGHNFLHRVAEDLTESVKGFLLRTTLG